MNNELIDSLIRRSESSKDGDGNVIISRKEYNCLKDHGPGIAGRGCRITFKRSIQKFYGKRIIVEG